MNIYLTGLLRFLVFIFYTVLLTGCTVVSLPQHQLKLAGWPPVRYSEKKLSATATIQTFIGNPEDKNLKPGTTPYDDFIRQNMEGSGIFSNVIFSKSHSTTTDLNIDIRVYVDLTKSSVIPCLPSYFSLGVIPCRATEYVSVQMDVYQKDGKQPHSVSNTDSIHVYMGMMFFPYIFKSPDYTLTSGCDTCAEKETISNQLRTALTNAYGAGWFAPGQ